MITMIKCANCRRRQATEGSIHLPFCKKCYDELFHCDQEYFDVMEKIVTI